MIKIYDTFHLVTSNDGILLVSIKNTDYPFFIVKNSKLNFLIMHAGEVNYNASSHFNKDLLDINCMITYNVEVAYSDSSHWAVAIPYKGMTLDPKALYAFTYIGIQKQFTVYDFPAEFDTYGSLSIVTGFCE